MKITGLITEYNPFHNGHLYHIRKSREVTNADYCIVLMSGSYVQRGAPAVYDKFVRATMALQAGADLVIEMPLSFSTASAMEFASYGIALFTALGAVESVCFGSESGLIEPLTRIASLLSNEPLEFSHIMKRGLKKGMTWPEARNQALLPHLTEEEQKLIYSPNNILGIEYIKAGIVQKSPLQFYTIKRKGQDYHEISVADSDGDSQEPASASTIRWLLDKMPPAPDPNQSMMKLLQSMVPAHALRMMMQEIPVFADDFSTLLNYRILKGDYSKIADMTPELEARIRKSSAVPISFEERVFALKTRQMTYTRISRALLHLLLDLREDDVSRFKEAGYAPYARILGFRKAALPLLKILGRSTSIPLITKLADAGKNLTPQALSMLDQEIQAAHIYQMIRSAKGGIFKNEYTQGVIVCDTVSECSP